MVMRLVTLLILWSALSAAGQSLPDSIVVIQNTYTTDFAGGENLGRQEHYSLLRRGSNYQLRDRVVAGSKMNKLLSEIA
jgi:hypothetical protein